MAEVATGAPLALYRSGPAEPVPVLLLHGFPLDALMWEPLIQLLPDVPVLAVDAPGFGDSPSFEEVAAAVGAGPEPSLETYADAVVATARAAGVGRAVVCGLSMGGYVALAIAERHPGFVAGIGLLDTKAVADDDAARANRFRVADAAAGESGAAAVAPMVNALLGATSREERLALVVEIEGMLAAAPVPGIVWGQRAMAVRPDRLAVLAGLSVPGLALRGAEDVLSTQENVEDMARALADSEVVVVPAAGHMSAMENPEPVAEALRRLRARALG